MAPLKLVVLGHVDHGKSTLIGHFLHDAGALVKGKMEAIQRSCTQRGAPFEWAFLLDALQEERDQNVTVDTTRIWLTLCGRAVVLIDAPGHVEFLRNMATGASEADAALIVVDATAGMEEQTTRHAMMLHVLGVKQVVMVVNKMDAVDYSEQVFRARAAECTQALAHMGIKPIATLPVSAREGAQLVVSSERMPWWQGGTLEEVISKIIPETEQKNAPLRMPVQDVYKWDHRRIIAGRISQGALSVGDTLLFSPANVTARVASIEAWPAQEKQVAQTGESIGFTLDTPIFVARGQVASHVANAPILTNRFRVRAFWLGRAPLDVSMRLKLRLGTAETTCEIVRIVAQDDVLFDVKLRTHALMAVDSGARCALFEGYEIAGGGVVDVSGYEDQRTQPRSVASGALSDEASQVTRRARALANGHLGGVLWFTGLSGSGKSTLARELERALFAAGKQVKVLDGDNIRKGLARDLGFSATDRAENLRRVAEVAALFAESGMIVIASFISPLVEHRSSARAIIGESFHEIYVKASLDACEARDAKGLYASARSGQLAEFTGISAPYEPPAAPELTVDTQAQDVSSCLELLLAYVSRYFALS